jgi:hypothetical protein
LLGRVLPSHPTLGAITFSACHFSGPQWELFASSVPSATAAAATAPTRLVSLDFEECPLGREGAAAIAAMVRGNAPLSALAISVLDDDGLDPDSCRLLCRSVPENIHLRALTLVPVAELRADTLEGVAAPSSPLHDLDVGVTRPMSDESLIGLARELKTNTTLRRLTLVEVAEVPLEGRRSHLFRPLEQVLETYNFTLEVVDVTQLHATHRAAQRRMDALLRRNWGIRSALEALQRLDPARRDHPRLLRIAPEVLAAAGRLPTLLYRFLRRGEEEGENNRHPHHDGGEDPPQQQRIERQQLRLLIAPRALAALGGLPTLLYRFVRGGGGDVDAWCRLVQQQQHRIGGADDNDVDDDEEEESARTTAG